jgi:molybdopterin molybdotransferase
MITQKEAHEIMMTHARTLGSEQVSLSEALHRVLAEDVCSDMDMPPFIKSAMDGYACRREDLDNDLRIVEILKAGAVPDKAIGPNDCSKIMTGGMVPEGADCVIMVEKTRQIDEATVRFVGESTTDNVCLQGEDIQEGDVVLGSGTRLLPQHIAMLASVGCIHPTVSRKPRVGVISTGDELVEPEVKPDISQIRSSNSHQLIAQLLNADAIPVYYGIVRDTEQSIDATLRKALGENDVVLLSGGVSMGDFDLVPRIMKTNGLTILFDEIAVQPGKPTTFAVSDDNYCVGLPGNPVATFTQFELLVKPFLYRLAGHEYQLPILRLPMGRTRTRQRFARDAWFPAKISQEGTVLPCEFHGSAHVESLCEADCLGSMPAGQATLEEGALATIRLI